MGKVLKILVTGGAGFIGSALIREIINNSKHSVMNLDKLTYAGNLSSLDSVSNSKRYCFEKADICDANHIRKVFNSYKPDLVMHLAAESHVDRSIDGPSEFIKTNIFGTYTLLEESKRFWEKQKKTNPKNSFIFHHISTDEVYGDLPLPSETDNKSILFSEDSSYKPSSPYSASKAGSDHLVRAWHRTYGLPVVVTNCSNNYGPYQFPEKLIPLIINNALEEKSLPVYGKGNQIRDWLYVDDHARALLLVATKGKIGETYNIGGHNEMENIEVVTAICRILDQIKPKQGKYENLITYVEDRLGHDKRYAIDASKMLTELNWSPIESFESGILKTVNWYLENQNWCMNLIKN